MASAVSTFSDLIKITGPSYLTSAEMVVNEAQKRNYLLRRFLKGHGPQDLVQGGSTIKDVIMGDEQPTALFYNPNETFTWEQPQFLTEWEIQWRFLADHMSWTDQDIELNAGGLGKGARHQMYKRKKYTLEQRMWTSMINKKETHLFAVPEVANMEAAGGKQPYSIPAFVNENEDGLFYKGAVPDTKTAWTTKAGIDPTADTWWKPQTGTYSTTLPTDDTNILGAFDTMWLDTRFVAPPTKQEYFENGELYAQFIACSKRGQVQYTRLMRASQDTLVTTSRQDAAYQKPQYAGIDLEYVDQLDTAALYRHTVATSAYQSEMSANADDKGPRYYWLNGMYLRPIWHTRRYMKKHKIREHPNQPFTSICPVDSWYNLAPRSLQRHGIVSPSGDVYTA